ncbi:MAG: hypothetical protein [Bacteriophage sp.]|nr:MAG: hypothetical protein [Bacteriophage sp.]
MAYGKPKITGAMPYKYCADDAQWIDAQLSMLAPGMRVQVAMAYAKAYVQEEQLHDVDYQKTGAARFAANTRLRKFVNKKIAP